jgi:hypothetical protein
MLVALLYQDDGTLTAAAPACDQEPLGDRYWREVLPDAVRVRGSETAYVDIDDTALLNRLVRMDFPNGREAAKAVDEYLGLAALGRP